MAASSTGGAVGVPSLTRSNNRGTLLQQAAGGLRPSADKLALKSAFFNGASSASLLPLLQAQHRVSMRAATKGAYICRDCGYIYADRKPFDKLSDDFRCPVCAAPKRRFKPYDLPVAGNANQLDARKARKEKLKSDAAVGNALPVGIVIGIAALVGTFLYLNSQY